MNKIQLQEKLDYYELHRGKYRRYLNWNSSPIRQLQKLFNEEIAILPDDQHFNISLMAKIRRIVGQARNGLTLDVCTTIQFQLGSQSINMRVIPFPDKRIDLDERVRPSKSVNICEEMSSTHPDLDDPYNWQPFPSSNIAQMSLRDHFDLLKASQSEDNENEQQWRRTMPDAFQEIHSTLETTRIPFGTKENTYKPETNNLPTKKKIARRIFFGKPNIALNQYRLGVYSEVKLTKEGMTLSADYEPIEIATPSINVIQETSEQLQTGQYYACFELEKKEGWQPLPSIGINETLTALNAGNNPYIIGYCKKSNLHFIKFSDPKIDTNVTIEYNLTVKPENKTPLQDNVNLSEKGISTLQKNDLRPLKLCSPLEQCLLLTAFFKGFSDETDEKITKENDLQQQWLNRLVNRNGVCRHRAAWFVQMAKTLSLPARLASNDLHDFVEVSIDNEWHKIDLGGRAIPEIVEQSALRPINFNISNLHYSVSDLLVKDLFLPKTEKYATSNVFNKIVSDNLEELKSRHITSSSFWDKTVPPLDCREIRRAFVNTNNNNNDDDGDDYQP